MSYMETASRSTQPHAPAAKSRTVFMPRADVAESPDALVVFADMPGVDETGIELTLEQNVLTLRGRVAVPEYSGSRLALEEYASGDYERSFVLGNDIQRDAIHASIKDGVLKVVLPKAQQARAHKIVVKAE